MIIEGADLVLVLDALDKKIWSLRQSGLSGAYKRVPEFRDLRERVAAEVRELERALRSQDLI